MVRASGRHYMTFETSCYHADLHAMRTIYQAGGFGKLLYSALRNGETMKIPQFVVRDSSGGRVGPNLKEELHDPLQLT